MAVARWGFANEGRKMATDQKAEKKKEAFWEVANDNVIIVPDIDAETEAIQQDVSKPMGLEVEKLVDFYDMQIETRKSTLPAPEEGVDLSLLLSMIRTGEELQERDEPWEFSKLKTEVYEMVSKLNKSL